ncbi:YkgJ family cysteine cluster protein [Limnobacter sp. 130]|uniref:YkgJ family cysteine cluster protein n=1 Tax=Limnobacter sp. 130 TaxID=2653147 RepID=UPI00135714F4|nr:hypothetical protein [Limnobacter sp. 130]
MNKNEQLVPGRECGSCNACCVALRIDEPMLKKHADQPCEHLSPDKGCSIYDSRPNTCRSWYCGWRQIEHLTDEWRPDRSKVIIRGNLTTGGFIIQPLGNPSEILIKINILEFIGGCIAAAIPIAITIPTRPGFCGVQLKLNQEFFEATQARDVTKIRAEMIKAIEFGEKFITEPIHPL